MVTSNGPIALIDATSPAARAARGSTVAGLGMLERTVRLADVTGCTRAAIFAPSEDERDVRETLDSLRKDSRWNLELDLIVSDDGAPQLPEHEPSSGTYRDTVVYLDAGHAYDRGLVDACIDRARRSEGTWTVRAGGETVAPVVAGPAERWSRTADGAGSPLDELERLRSGGISDDSTTLEVLDVAEGWVEATDSPEGVARADERIWLACYKSVDGPISRYLNRPLSLAISRRLAPTDVTPNQMSVVTFLSGLASAAALLPGGFWWFLLGAVLYQISSILDGVDGELARARYEFSLFGEWADSLSDNVKDIFFYLALGYGAWRTAPFDAVLGDPSVWMWLGAVAAAGKFLSFAGYAVWMVPNGTGCPAYFDWGDEETADDEPSDWADRTAEALQVLAKNDVVLFAAFALGVVGLLPWFLVVVAVGHPVVAVSIAHRLWELRRNSDSRREAPAEPN